MLERDRRALHRRARSGNRRGGGSERRRISSRTSKTEPRAPHDRGPELPEVDELHEHGDGDPRCEQTETLRVLRVEIPEEGELVEDEAGAEPEGERKKSDLPAP